jgi:predicted phage baseplate assembly protein
MSPRSSNGSGPPPWVAWKEVRDFADSKPEDLHYTLDDVTGELRFGPAVRSRDGTERSYGATPPQGALLRFTRYRSGGGAAGSVGKDTITVLRSAPAYIDRVTNRVVASGGRDAERLEEVMVRAPKLLRTRERAVTAEDFEELTLQYFREIARARCLQPRVLGRAGSPPPGQVSLLLVPMLDEHTPVSITSLKLPDELKERVSAFFDERRLLTCVVEVTEPEYYIVTVEAKIRARPDADHGELSNLAADRLYRFINPLRGGPRGEGWPFGRDLYISEIYGALQGLPGAEYIETVEMYLDQPGRGRTGPHQRLDIPDNALSVSAEHKIVVATNDER